MKTSIISTKLGALILSLAVAIAATSVITTLSGTARAGDNIWREKTVRTPYIDPTFNNQLVKLAKDAMPAVVAVAIDQTVNPFGGRPKRQDPNGGQEPFDDFFDFFFGPQQRREFHRRGMGSGFIINPEGYIFTNSHVVEDADNITVGLADGREFKAKVIGADPRTDMALIKIDAGNNLPFLPFGDSDALQVGEIVVAIGNPLGLTQSVTQGIVSQKGRKDINPSGRNIYSNFIQTDASINPGNSGGPLLNIYGEVIGINSAIAQANGIGFAIPINMAKTLLPQLFSGKVKRSWLGVQVQEVSNELAGSLGLPNSKGALVISVVPGSPADKAGIKPEDVVLQFDGKEVASTGDLTWMASMQGVDKKVGLKLWRDKKEMNLEVTLGKLPEDETAEEPAGPKAPAENGNYISVHGLTVAPPTPQQLSQAAIKDGQGVVVVKLNDATPAGRSGLMKGDIIRKVNRTQITDVKSYKAAIEGIPAGGFVRLLVNRRQAALFIAYRQ